jgi:hypothetical protein
MKKITTAAVQSFIDDDVPKPLLQFIKETKAHRLRLHVHKLNQSVRAASQCAPTLHNMVISKTQANKKIKQ